MSIEVKQTGVAHLNGHIVVEQAMYKPEGEIAGTVVYTRPLDDFRGAPEGVFFGTFLVDENGSADMNINVGFSGTPEDVYNGGDASFWTFSNLSGTGFTASSITHAKEGIAVVVDFNNLSGDTVVIDGTNITNTTLTEGVNWTAATSNNATATSLALAINGVSGVSASSSGAVITVKANGNSTDADITTFTNSDNTNLTTTAQSLASDSPMNGDIALFEDGTSIDMSNFTAFTGSILLTSWNSDRHDIAIQARLNGTNVGNSVNVSDFIDETTLNSWQPIIVTKSLMGLDLQTIDEIILTVSRTGGPSTFFIDIMQFEASGSPVLFTFRPPIGFQLKIIENSFIFSDTSSATSLNPNDLWTLSELSNGLVVIITKDKVTVAARVNRTNLDLLATEGTRLQSSDVHFTGSEVWGKMVVNILGEPILRSSQGDSISIQVSDDLSGLDFFRANISGKLQREIPV